MSDTVPGRPSRTPSPVGRFPLVIVVGSLTGVSLVGIGLLNWLVPMLFTDGDGARQAVLVGALTAYGVTVISLVPVALRVPQGVMAIVGAYFAGAGLRLIGCIAAIVVAVVGWQLPPGPLVLGLSLYVPLLFIETGFIGRYLWRQDETTPATTESSP